MSQVMPPGLVRSFREQAGEDQGGLAAARAADHCHHLVALDFAQQVLACLLAAEEEAGVFLAKWQQAAIRAYAGFELGRGVFFRLAVDRGDQRLELCRVVEIGAQVDPGLEAEEAGWLVVEARQQDRDDGEVALAALAVEGDLDLAVLPGAHALAEEHGDRAGPTELSFERRLPGLPRRQAGPIEETGDAGFAQACADRLDRVRIGTAVAEKNLAGGCRNHNDVTRCRSDTICMAKRLSIRINWP